MLIKKTNRYFTKFKEGVKQHKLILYTQYFLFNLGIQIVPFYLTREYPNIDTIKDISRELSTSTCTFLTPLEMGKIYAHPETVSYAKTKGIFSNDKCLCYALKNEDEILSFVCCDLLKCHSVYYTFHLKADEAYLFHAYTYSKYRGMNLSPYLRSRLYQKLTEMGRFKYYSITEYLNSPAKKLKKKIKARHLKLVVFMGLFNVFKWRLTVKKYPEEQLDK